MPEYDETKISSKTGHHFHETEPPNEQIIEQILVDGTEDEQKAEMRKPASKQDALLVAGHVYELLSSSKIARGQRNSQTLVYPKKYATAPNQPTLPISTHGLRLSGVYSHPRNVIFKFTDHKKEDYWVQIQLFQHTFLQIYEKSKWNGSVAVVSREERGFKVGIVFVFKNYIMSFNTQDMLMQFEPFLAELAAWLETRRKSGASNRSQNATEIIRKQPIFCGVGVYTISEIFHRAGLSPSLTEAELFDSASRTARLVAAFYSFVHRGQVDDKNWTLVRRHMVGYTIAVTVDDRLKYSNTLSVYGKQRAYLTPRFISLLQRFEASSMAMSSKEELTMLWVSKRKAAGGDKGKGKEQNTTDKVAGDEGIIKEDNGEANVQPRRSSRRILRSSHGDAQTPEEKDSNPDEGEEAEEEDEEILIPRCPPHVDGSQMPYDVFEPNLCLPALLMQGERSNLNLGALIFGPSAWERLAHEAGLDEACIIPDNPLSRLYSKPEFAATSHLWLDTTAYKTLDSPELPDVPIDPVEGLRSQRAKGRKWRPTHAYRIQDTNIWSIIPLYSSLTTPDSPVYVSVPGYKRGTPKPITTKIEVYGAKDQSNLTLSHVIQYTEQYTVGPLDYCGVARRIKTAGIDVIMYCKRDPQLSLSFHEQWAFGIEVARLKLDGTNKQGIGRMKDQTIPQKSLQKITNATRPFDSSDTLSSSSNSWSRRKRRVDQPSLPAPISSDDHDRVSPPGPLKKRRQSADYEMSQLDSEEEKDMQETNDYDIPPLPPSPSAFSSGSEMPFLSDSDGLVGDLSNFEDEEL
ncbi:hypothetical protein H0H93_012193 [Arthromyces matolae]|nr:hypothetical protein H0H93_012193 [Arthromyces matolae]